MITEELKGQLWGRIPTAEPREILWEQFAGFEIAFNIGTLFTCHFLTLPGLLIHQQDERLSVGEFEKRGVYEAVITTAELQSGVVSELTVRQVTAGLACVRGVVELDEASLETCQQKLRALIIIGEKKSACDPSLIKDSNCFSFFGCLPCGWLPWLLLPMQFVRLVA